MKAFIIAVLMLILTVVVTVTVSHFGISRTEELIALTGELMSADNTKRAEKLEEITVLWEKSELLLSLSLYRSELERVKTIIISLSEISDKDELSEEFTAVARLLSDQLRHIKKLNSVTLDGIL